MTLDEKTPARAGIMLIGIGSSAGGLEAVRELVAALPNDVPASYIVVQHMSPNYKSVMTELVARQTQLEVVNVTDGVIPQANVIYITPPNNDIIVSDGKLRLIPPSIEAAAPKPSVNRFFLSLADSHGENTMGIILSGTGGDGANGLQAIHEAGGITIAQDNDSAKYDGMPRAAVQTGCVDLIMEPKDIGKHLEKILAVPRDFDELRRSRTPLQSNSDVLKIVQARTRMDFREYAQTTVSRRIGRRMMALGIPTKEEYATFLRNTPEAVDDLFKDLLISVTRFFRDPEEFEALRRLLPTILAKRDAGPLRVWIAGCATGEEAYSITIMLAEALGVHEDALKTHIQVFATDIDVDALKVARRGVYNSSVLDDIPKDLADKYLHQHPDGVQVIDAVRGVILFSEHNVAQDPPFQKIDLLCCRNMMIYFGAALQTKVMSRFHYALKDNALLFVGKAETAGGSDHMFMPDRTSSHIFRKRGLRLTGAMHYASYPAELTRRKNRPKPDPSPAEAKDRNLFDALAQSLGKDALLVTRDFSIARVYGDVSGYVQMDAKSALKMHLDLLRLPLREEARSLVTIALKNNQKRTGVRHLLDTSDESGVRLDVYPIIAEPQNENVALVTFTPVEPIEENAAEEEPLGSETNVEQRIKLLEREVNTTREALQQTNEELENSNDELQSLNEELQSTNEELQATNEELETSNEELQSTNEELISVNEELEVTASELRDRTSELTSVLENAPISVLVMDTALQITQATHKARDRFGLRRPLSTPHISQCTLPDGFPALGPICLECLGTGLSDAREFTAGTDRVVLTCAPYFDTNGQIMGVTLCVSEYTGLAREMETILESSELFVMHRSADGEILRLSEQAANMIGLDRHEAVGKKISDIVPDEAAKHFAKVTQEILKKPGNEPIREEREIQLREDAAPVWQSIERFRFSRGPEHPSSVITVGTDVTERRRAAFQVKSHLKQLELLQDIAGVGYWSLDLVTEKITWSAEVYRIHGEDPAKYQPVLSEGIQFYHPDDVALVTSCVENSIKRNEPFDFQLRIVRRDGTVVPVESKGIPIVNEKGDVDQMIGVFRQIGPEE